MAMQKRPYASFCRFEGVRNVLLISLQSNFIFSFTMFAFKLKVPAELLTLGLDMPPSGKVGAVFMQAEPVFWR